MTRQSLADDPAGPKVSPIARGPGGSGRVLLADDDAVAANALADVLRRAGFRVLVANGGKQALRRLGTEPFDLLITEIVMAEFDGLDLLRWLSRLQPSVPAIALSGDGPDQGALYAKAAVCLGADLALSKPADPGTVLAAAHRLTGQGGRVSAPGRMPAPAA
jgi:CheY-like chemotaxis protein